MAVTWDKALFDAAYQLNAEPDGHPNTRAAIMLHYNRYVLAPEQLRRAQFFIQQFNLTAADSVLDVGCGFGWTVEALNNLGIPTIGTDVSAYIQGNKSLNEDSDIDAAIRAVGLDPTNGEGLGHFNRLRGGGVRTTATVLNEDSSTNASRNRVKNAALSGNFTLIITEDLVTSLTDSECAVLQSNIVKYGATIRICHFLTEFANPNAPFFFNSKSLADWKLLFPTATIIADGYVYRVA
jgi:hypothetical protein